MPVQAPPIRALRPEEDDPAQPWSPNYGKGKIGEKAPPSQVEPRTSPRQIDAALKPTFVESTGGLRAMSDDEADAIMQSAIAIHEMRNQ